MMYICYKFVLSNLKVYLLTVQGMHILFVQYYCKLYFYLSIFIKESFNKQKQNKGFYLRRQQLTVFQGEQ